MDIPKEIPTNIVFQGKTQLNKCSQGNVQLNEQSQLNKQLVRKEINNSIKLFEKIH